MKTKNSVLDVLIGLVFAAMLGLALLVMLPKTTKAEESGDYGYRVNENETATITAYRGSASSLEIPAAIDGYSVTGIESGVFDHRTSLVKDIYLHCLWKNKDSRNQKTEADD